MAVSGGADEHRDVVDDAVPLLEHRALALRPAVPPVVERIDGVAGCRELLPDVAVAPGVLAEAVGDHQGRSWVVLREPRLPIDLGAGGAGNRLLQVLHGQCSAPAG
jgi:hypothetical protein